MRGWRAVLLVCLLSAGTRAGAETLFVQSLKADLLAEPRFGAPVVATVPKGTELDLLETGQGWHRAGVDGKAGWVPRLLVADHPPLQRASLLTGNEETLEGGARRRASAVTTAGAARGLTAEDRGRVGAEDVDYRALARLEALVVDDQEAVRFLREGLEQ